MVFDLKQLPQYSCFAYLSTQGGFRIPRMPSSLKGWKDKWFYAIPQDLDVPFSPRWGVPDTARFCGGQAYFESLERHRQMLEELEPLVYDLDDILGDDILELANMKGIEEMTFDPSALRQAVNKKSKAPQARAPGPSPGIVRTGSQQQDQQGTPRGSVPRGPVDVVDLEDGSLPPGPANPEGCSRCHSVLSIVDKYRADVDLSNGLRALEAMALKTLGIARGLSLKEKDESSKMADLEGAVSARDLRIADLEEERAQLLREREHMRNDLRSAQGEAGTAKAEAEHFKLELDQLKKDFDEKLASAREEAIEDFKKSDAFNELKGDYAMGSYFHALKEARAFMPLRPDACPEDLKSIPEVADDLHLSESEENAGDEDVDIEVPSMSLYITCAFPNTRRYTYSSKKKFQPKESLVSCQLSPEIDAHITYLIIMSSGECSYWPVRAAALTGFARTVDRLPPGCCRVGGAHRHNSLQSGKPNGEEDSQISFFFSFGLSDWRLGL
ncbi:uncharacterized protein LOC111412517 [Olea europaea var. sylvestris]|uniref:uncharacterized protein LOC111412517 n=1 Tax=Olea europaea var. sylvestris TaxID=158386 RepID=UPI000C1D1A26|nr:uncharacterized protein LOC111412517 [Olea europaea var. sylvestris]